MARSLCFETEVAGEGTSRDVDVLLECSGAPTALADGLWRLRTNGRAAMVGMPKQDVTLALSRLNVNELTIGLVNRYAHTWPTAIDLVASGRVDVKSLVTHRFPLDGTADALMLAKHVPDSVKAVISPQQRSS
jgi:L-iditol 2-dehydrogenase